MTREVEKQVNPKAIQRQMVFDQVAEKVGLANAMDEPGALLEGDDCLQICKAFNIPLSEDAQEAFGDPNFFIYLLPYQTLKEPSQLTRIMSRVVASSKRILYRNKTDSESDPE
ncbi:MAG: hypothetical protein ACD_13C00039G0002 [uncultured bacterium]|uniref:Uncharacterized protein n=1 Tax=Candidatus Curtissbacteria bacterium RIFOXYA1_FULL_41_14 TaxID=1797737 RepID=A0A1F5HFW0_9BACT|nr:MAG: hypothetical protein ACD_13C00039G0002 [uncultured bacterium]KKR75351.1 MAG: hypothetical protein UU19_C0060G0006 [Candidatus Curtissbacteria bacterium GW2011_GWD1_40_8]KKS01218.1 MAG: hypothetical protein UU53_C0016G0005 [Candidatus Curtissbacteria bacterium GW2011_GWC2_41_21]OGE03037.1 MAG: hypothetical protein A2196_01220 [Candidatus Curtissbacteria bacterium RIFOXYA1_FULL_41_14]OGE04128.1 MAG: hypothetical protein A2362_04095 [Candidatus Curtissbacteria bacterium RIFOXYB1_FULL_41_59